MKNYITSLAKRGVSSKRQPCGFGYVMVPVNQDRDTYISHSLRNLNVSILTDGNEFLNEVSVDKNVIQSIVFPETSKGIGSLVMWQSVPKHSKIVITNIFNFKSEYSEVNDESEFCIERRYQDSFVSVTGSGKRADLNITVKGKESDQGKVNLTVLNNSNDALLNVLVKGTISIETLKKIALTTNNEFSLKIVDAEKSDSVTEISYKLGEGLTIKDEFGNTFELNKDGVNFIAPQFVFSKTGTTEPAVLGDKNADVLTDLLTKTQELATQIQAAAITDSVVAGGLGLVGWVGLNAILQVYITTLSTIPLKIDSTKSAIVKIE